MIVVIREFRDSDRLGDWLRPAPFAALLTSPEALLTVDDNEIGRHSASPPRD